MLLMISILKKLLDYFMKKNYKRLISKNLEQKKLLKEKKINYMSNAKVMIVHLVAGVIKKISCDSIVQKISQYFSKQYEASGGDAKVKVDLLNYATKTDLKNISHVDTSSFALKTNLDSLKTEVNELYIIKLEPVPVDLSKLYDVVKYDVFKKLDMINQLLK